MYVIAGPSLPWLRTLGPDQSNYIWLH
uniref:Uncharacterized protein n=1 Tax=Arundo donax TaxID=35708 RepID=A0A0A9GPZ6_ARUDO